RVSYGLAGSVTYKNFDVSFLFSGIGQSHKYTNGWGVTEVGLVGFYSGWHREAWTPERYANGETIRYPALSMNGGVSQVAYSVFIMDRSFLRLKNAEVGYSLPKSWLGAINVQQVRAYVN